MKTLLRSVLLFGAATMLLFGCEDIDLTKHGVAPEHIGDISFDRTRIGTGQPIVATCDLPSGGENIESVQYTWQFGNGISYTGKRGRQQKYIRTHSV